MKETKPQPFVFVLMPFSDDFSDIYEVGIKPACKDAGAYCERVDEQIFVENILERVYNQIAKADVIVAEMTGRNPNVFYEVGYAHGLKKRVILLTKHADDIPFDLKHYPHVIYDGKIASLKTQLESRIRWCMENPIEPSPFSKSNHNMKEINIEIGARSSLKGEGIYKTNRLTSFREVLKLVKPDQIELFSVSAEYKYISNSAGEEESSRSPYFGLRHIQRQYEGFTTISENVRIEPTKSWKSMTVEVSGTYSGYALVAYIQKGAKLDFRKCFVHLSIGTS